MSLFNELQFTQFIILKNTSNRWDVINSGQYDELFNYLFIILMTNENLR